MKGSVLMEVIVKCFNSMCRKEIRVHTDKIEYANCPTCGTTLSHERYHRELHVELLRELIDTVRREFDELHRELKPIFKDIEENTANTAHWVSIR